MTLLKVTEKVFKEIHKLNVEGFRNVEISMNTGLRLASINIVLNYDEDCYGDYVNQFEEVASKINIREPEEKKEVVQIPPYTTPENSENERRGEIITHLDQILNQLGFTTNKLHNSLDAVNYQKELTTDDIQKLNLYLSYSARFSDFARLRLSQSPIRKRL